jgi:oligopeptide/dipeptide ABC transporter ATP-binding protein
MKVIEIVAEPLRAQGHPARVARAEARTALDEVQIDRRYENRYPHQLSGGQRQRVALARALAARPDLIVLDEPVSSLDASVRAGILNLLSELQTRHGIAYLLISHNLASVSFLASRVGVMYLGRIVEEADAASFFDLPLHPYARALVAAAMPQVVLASDEEVIRGDPPSAINIPPGCAFHPRCPFAFARCAIETPELQEVRPGRTVACHLYDDDAALAAANRQIDNDGYNPPRGGFSPTPPSPITPVDPT